MNLLTPYLNYLIQCHMPQGGHQQQYLLCQPVVSGLGMSCIQQYAVCEERY